VVNSSNDAQIFERIALPLHWPVSTIPSAESSALVFGLPATGILHPRAGEFATAHTLDCSSAQLIAPAFRVIGARSVFQVLAARLGQLSRRGERSLALPLLGRLLTV